MKIYGLSGDVSSLSLGVFDGFHLGHQALFSTDQYHLTFLPHPDRVLRKNGDIKLLSTLRELRCYIPRLLVLRFTSALANLSADDFLNRVIYERCRPTKIVVGYDFLFGSRCKGDAVYLQKWGVERGIAVDVVTPVSKNGRVVKSSLIRSLMLSGDVDEGIGLLGHSYLISGVVVVGEQRGRRLGFPTLNLRVSSVKLIPACGVYQVSVSILDVMYRGIAYIGSKPTYHSGANVGVEVHVFSFDGNVYGQRVSVFVERKVRGEMAFSSEHALVEQIRRDIKVVF